MLLRSDPVAAEALDAVPGDLAACSDPADEQLLLEGLRRDQEYRSAASCYRERGQRAGCHWGEVRRGEVWGGRCRWAVVLAGRVVVRRWGSVLAAAADPAGRHFFAASEPRSVKPHGAENRLARRLASDRRGVRTCVYNIASSDPCPLLFAVNRTQNTLHHLQGRPAQPEREVGDPRPDEDSLEQQTLLRIYRRL